MLVVLHGGNTICLVFFFSPAAKSNYGINSGHIHFFVLCSVCTCNKSNKFISEGSGETYETMKTSACHRETDIKRNGCYKAPSAQWRAVHFNAQTICLLCTCLLRFTLVFILNVKFRLSLLVLHILVQLFKVWSKSTPVFLQKKTNICNSGSKFYYNLLHW